MGVESEINANLSLQLKLRFGKNNFRKFLDFLDCLCSIIKFRKYEQRRERLKSAMAWWDDEDHNPDIHYLDYSKRKILFQDRYSGFPTRRMCV